MAKFDGVNIPLNYIVEGQKQVADIQKQVEKLGQTTTKMQTDVQKLSSTFTNGFNQARMVLQGMQETFNAFNGIFGKGIKGMMQYELELAKIQGVLSSQGKDPAMVGQMEALAGQMSKQSFFKKGEILGVERLIMTFESMSSDTLPKATAAAVGLATVMDVDLRSAALALGKAMDSPAEGMKSLRRMGVILNQEDRERIKLLDEEGLKYEAQQVILGAVERKYRDVYEAIKDTDAFQLAQAEKAIAGMQKNAAALELQFLRPFIGMVDTVANGLRKLGPEVQAVTGLTLHLTAAYALLSTTGLASTIKSVLFMGPSIKSLTIAQMENVIMTRTMTAAQQTEALAAYEAALANKAFFASLGPAGWAVMALAALVPVLYMIGDTTEDNAQKQEEYNQKLQKMDAKQMQVQLAGIGLELTSMTKKLESMHKVQQNINAQTQGVMVKDAARLELEEKIRAKKQEQAKIMERQKQLAEDIKQATMDMDEELEIMAQGTDKERNKMRDQKWYERSKAKIDQMAAAESDGKKVNSPEVIKRLRDNLEKAFKNKQSAGDGTVRRESQTGSESLMEQLREEVKNTDSIEAMYQALRVKWDKIDTLSVKKRSGKVDEDATKNQREKMKNQSADIVQQELQRVLRDNVRAAEVEAELAGGSKLDVLNAKQKAYNDFVEKIKTQKRSTGEPNVLDTSTVKQILLERMQLSAQIGEEQYRERERELARVIAIDAKWAEIEGASEMERYEIKREGLMKQLELARLFYQQEEADKIEHDVILLDIDAEGMAKRAQERYEQYAADIAGKGSSSGYASDKAKADEDLLNGKRKIANDELLTVAQKNALIEELERAHGIKVTEIRAQYYDGWLGQLANVSKEEIDSAMAVVDQVQSAFNSTFSILDATAQAEADKYREKENAKIDADEKRELASARSEKQRAAIQEKYAARREQMEAEADKKGKERVATIFALQKAAGIASVLISTYKGAAAAVEPPPTGAGPIMGPILAAATIAAGLAQVAALSSQEMPKYATGGYVTGPGGGRDDRITARLSNGEYVVNADATRRNRNILEMINGGVPFGFAQGAGIDGVRAEIAELRGAILARPINVSVPIGDSECRKIVGTGAKVIKKGSL